MASRVEVYAAATALLGEGPSWDAGRDRLVWVDILQRRVHLSDREETQTYSVPAYVGAAVPAEDGTLLLALGTGFATLRLSDGTVTPLVLTAADPSTLRMNDGKTDPLGRFWAGTMGLAGEPDAGALYRLEPDGSVREMIAPVTISNGLDWSAGGQWLYYIDTARDAVFRYDLVDDEVSSPSLLVDTHCYAGFPDGMTVDADGNLWVAFWGGAAVRCFSGDSGELLDEISVPVTHATSCAFGGPGLRELLVTTARHLLGECELREQQLAGSVLCLETGVRGLPREVARLPNK